MQLEVKNRDMTRSDLEEAYKIQNNMRQVLEAKGQIDQLRKILEQNKDNEKAIQALKELDELEKKLEETINKIEEERVKLNENLKQERKSLPEMREEFKKAVKEQLELAKQKGDTIKIQKYQHILDEIESAITLKFLKDYPKVPDYIGKGRKRKKRKFSEIAYNARKKLKDNKHYTFRDPKYLEQILNKHLDGEYAEKARLFLKHFYSFILSNKIDNYAVFISQTIANIYTLDIEKNEELLNNIKSIIDMYKE